MILGRVAKIANRPHKRPGIMDYDHTSPAPATVDFTFTGAHTRSVDTKGRFNLPVQFRTTGENRYVIAPGAENTLALMPYAVWVDNYNRLRSSKPGPKLRAKLRKMSRESQVVETDLQGRIAVSREILADYEIDRKVAVIGVGRFMELWNPDTLNEFDDGDDNFDAVFMDEFYR